MAFAQTQLGCAGRGNPTLSGGIQVESEKLADWDVGNIFAFA